jgi:hypothetical protein
MAPGNELEKKMLYVSWACNNKLYVEIPLVGFLANQRSIFQQITT